MAVNHQYNAGGIEYSGATEVVIDPVWNSTLVKTGQFNQSVKFIRRGSLVTVVGLQMLDAPIAGNTVLSVLPPSLRPATTATFSGYTLDNEHRTFNVQPNGHFYSNTEGLSSYFWLDGSYWV